MSKRPETGPMQFEGDWTGLFLRGDDAFSFGKMLAVILKAKEGEPLDVFAKKNLEEFAVQLVAVKLDETTEPTKLQSFDRCLDEGRIDFLTAPASRWIRFPGYEGLDLWLHDGTPLTVLFPDGTVADGKAKSTIFIRADSTIQAWGAVVNDTWYDLIDLKVDRESLPVEVKP